MDNIAAHLIDFVELNDRVLWFDGDLTVSMHRLLSAIADGIPSAKLFVEEITTDIVEYNNLVSRSNAIKVKTQADIPDIHWEIPDPFSNIDPIQYVLDLAQNPTGSVDDNRFQRVCDELELYTKLHLLDVLKVLIYIINTFRHNNIVWGVGRGSSVSSYVLYLIGVHDVDSVLYDLPIHDFLQ